jgi:tetratricopeptide (TPR) repeat protein
MSKKLKTYTIIPSSLYVHRDADRQLRTIIEDMGRPGYVLVSRQMGKTNLLLNAKRELETNNDTFVYIDLSNQFDTARACFENIVDTVIETNPDKFFDIQSQINEKRMAIRDTPAHKQHTSELRFLLNKISGKIVIILDEIDALTKTDYSDQIFSQIRSVYFSRANFEELHRLTYVLSGVVEPSEIIRDPKISPFNIGQKIFLNDFSREEFDCFLLKAELCFSEQIKEKIFSWTQGNPRITWDVCSEVEEFLSKSTEVLTECTVDNIIESLYLKSFDKPPVDNIRDIVKNDREIRNALIEIQYSKGAGVADRLKSRLYLTGIINYESNNNIRIKNPIIEKSLDSNWLMQIEEAERGILRVGLDLYEKGHYSESLLSFERYIHNTNPVEEDLNLCYYSMANASYRLSNFENALNYLEKAELLNKIDSDFYFPILHLKGLVLNYLQKYMESILCFKSIIDKCKKGDLYIRALLNFASISLKFEDPIHDQEALMIFEQIISGVAFNNVIIKQIHIEEIKCIAYYNAAHLHAGEGKNDLAVQYLNSAVTIASPNVKPTIFLAMADIAEAINDKISLLAKSFEFAHVAIKLGQIEDPEKPIDFNLKHLQKGLLIAFEVDKANFFKLELLKVAKCSGMTFGQNQYNLVFYAFENGARDIAIALLDDLYKNRENTEYSLDQVTKYKVFKFSAFFSDPKENINKSSEYAKKFFDKQQLEIDNNDFDIFANLIYAFIAKEKYSEALKLITKLDTVKSVVPRTVLVNYLAIYNLELNLHIKQKNSTDAKQTANKIIKLTSEEGIKNQKSNLLGETGYEIIKNNAESVLNPNSRGKPFVKTEKIYSRNSIVMVRYYDGTVFQSKFKKIETDLKAGKCFIVDEK